MNVEAWQAQQKAQKDEERKRKTQAADALRSYKGSIDEDASKLAAMKEQERLQKLEAEKQLRGYRGTLSEEDTKLAAMKEEERRRKLEAAGMLHEYQGTLSEEDAKLAAQREEERRQRQESQQKLYLNVVQGNENSDGLVTPGSVSAMTDKFNVPSSGMDAITATQQTMEAAAIPAPAGAASMESQSTNAGEGLSAPVPGTAMPGAGFQTPDEPFVSSGMVDTSAPVNLLQSGQNQTTTPQVQAPTRLSVNFMFGLISDVAGSPLDGYLATIDGIIVGAIGVEAKASLAFEYPTVLNIETDVNYRHTEGRPGVTRRLVTISVPFTAQDPSSGEQIRTTIVEAVRSSIRGGTFKKQF